MDAETKADLRVKVRRRVSEYIQKSGLPLNRTGSGETEAVCPNCGQTASVKKIPLEEHFEFWKCDSCGAELKVWPNTLSRKLRTPQLQKDFGIRLTQSRNQNGKYLELKSMTDMSDGGG